MSDFRIADSTAHPILTLDVNGPWLTIFSTDGTARQLVKLEREGDVLTLTYDPADLDAAAAVLRRAVSGGM